MNIPHIDLPSTATVTTRPSVRRDVICWALTALLLVLALLVGIIGVDADASFSVQLRQPRFYLMAFLAYAMYIARQSGGRQRGRRSDTYAAALDRYNASYNALQAAGADARLPDFCAAYVAQELASSRLAMLSVTHIDYDTYIAKYCGRSRWELRKKHTPELSAPQRKAVCRANAIKPIKLRPTMLTGSASAGKLRGRSVLPLSEQAVTVRRSMVKMVTSAISTAVSCIMVYNVAVDLSAKSIATGLTMLMPVLLNSVTGDANGYASVTEDAVAGLDAKAGMLKLATAWVA